MGLLLLGEKRTQDTHSEWLSSCRGWKGNKEKLSRLMKLDPTLPPQLCGIYIQYVDNLYSHFQNPNL